jgi:hypothetical protein
MIQKILKSGLRKGIDSLPRSVRDPLVRRMIHMDTEFSAGLVIKLAETADEFRQAFTILHDSYVAEGLMKPTPERLRVTLYHAVPTTAVAIALLGGEVVATASLIPENALGLPMDVLVNMDQAFSPTRRVAEVSSLAVRGDLRHKGGSILFPLLAYVYRYAQHYAAVDALGIAVNPKWITFYESLLLFTRLQSEVIPQYGFVNGAPAVIAARDMRTYPRDLQAAYASYDPAKNMHHLLVSRPFENFIYPEKRYNNLVANPMSLKVMDELFNKRTDLFAKTTDEERLRLRNLLPTTYHRILPEPQNRQFIVERGMISSPRFLMHAAAMAEINASSLLESVAVWDASQNGLCVRWPEAMPMDAHIRLSIRISDHKISRLQGQPVWKDGHGFGGLKIVKADHHWSEMIAYLENRGRESNLRKENLLYERIG